MVQLVRPVTLDGDARHGLDGQSIGVLRDAGVPRRDTRGAGPLICPQKPGQGVDGWAGKGPRHIPGSLTLVGNHAPVPGDVDIATEIGREIVALGEEGVVAHVRPELRIGEAVDRRTVRGIVEAGDVDPFLVGGPVAGDHRCVGHREEHGVDFLHLDVVSRVLGQDGPRERRVKGDKRRGPLCQGSRRDALILTRHIQYTPRLVPES